MSTDAEEAAIVEAGDNHPIDMTRLNRPEAEAFRYLADALGARFAGDLPDMVHPALPSPAPRPAPHAARPPAGAADVSLVDPRAAALLDRVPVAILVIVGDGVAHMNKAAAALFGYTSAAILDAAGGLGALFDGQDPSAPGVVHMASARGRRFSAKVTMATVEWCGARAMLFTVIPSADVPDARPPAAAHTPAEPRDPLVALLDANPDPIAIVSRGGAIEVCNAAFQNLGGSPDAVRLDDRLAPGDLRHVFDVMQLSFFLSDGAAQTTHPIRVGGETFAVTVGALKNGRLACLVFHRAPPEATPLRPPSPPANDVREVIPRGATPLWRAVREVRRLVRDAALLVVSEGDEVAGGAEPEGEREAETQLLRLTLLAVAARAPAGTVLTVRRVGADYALSLAPERQDALVTAATSDRLLALAAAAGRTIVLGSDGVLTLARTGCTAAAAAGAGRDDA